METHQSKSKQRQIKLEMRYTLSLTMIGTYGNNLLFVTKELHMVSCTPELRI